MRQWKLHLLFIGLMAMVALTGCGTGDSGDTAVPVVIPTTATTGIVNGIVKNSLGTVLPNAIIVVDGQVATAGSNGLFTATSVPAGSQSIMATKEGYNNYSNAVMVTAGATTTHHITMFNSTSSDTTKPTEPQILAINAVPSGANISINIAWTVSTDNVALAGYYIYENVISNVVATSNLFNSIVATNRLPLTRYCYWIRAFDTAGNLSVQTAGISNVCITTPANPDVVLPTAPSLALRPASSRSIILNWTDATDDRDTSLTYALFRGGQLIANDLTTTTYIDTGYDSVLSSGLSPNTTYSYSVMAKDDAGNTNTTGSSSVTTMVANFYGTPSGGALHSMMLLSNGTIFTFGYNNYGQLGNNASVDSSLPVGLWSPYGGSDYLYVDVEAGEMHSLSLRNNGEVFAWGRNDRYQLGDGTTSASSIPVRVISNAVDIAAGLEYSVALIKNGTIYGWGSNDSLQLGNITSSSHMITRPTMIPGITNVTKIAAGDRHMVALIFNGTVWAWGDNYYYQLGNSDVGDQAMPKKISDTDVYDIIDIAAGKSHTLALRQVDKTVWGWGINDKGQLGRGSATVAIATPVSVLSLPTNEVTAIAAGDNHNVALLSNGTVMTWGDNSNGQLGIGNLITKYSPQTVPSLTARRIAAFGNTTAVYLTNGTIMAWGQNDKGQLGIGNPASLINSPAIVNGITSP